MIMAIYSFGVVTSICAYGAKLDLTVLNNVRLSPTISFCQLDEWVMEAPCCTTLENIMPNQINICAI